MLILFDVRELGLKKADDFMSVDVYDSPADNEWDDWGADDPYKRSDTSQDAPFYSGTVKGTTPMNGGSVFGGGKHNTEIM